MNVTTSPLAKPLRHASPAIYGREQRRGVLLIVVLSMLMLFLLLGMTYIVLASRARTTSRAYLRMADEQSRTTLALRPLLREAAHQVIRGSQKNSSALKYHDLLGDRYGSAASTVEVVPNSQKLIAPGGINAGHGKLLTLVLKQSVPAGRVLTFINGPAGVAGTSARIIEADDTTVTVIRPQGLGSSSTDQLSQITKVAINQPDFIGTGFTGGSESLPNWSLLLDSPTGEQNEDWDAPDLDNIALGMADDSVTSFTSLHRGHVFDDLVQRCKDIYDLTDDSEAVAQFVQLIRQTSPADDVTKLNLLKDIRRAILRPFAFDHKTNDAATIDFAGKPIDEAGLWTTLTTAKDVDADGDGQLDSVWVDFGEQPFAMPDGTLVKPLAAIKCIDLGGRLNVNAHGSPAHLVADPSDTSWVSDTRLANSAGAMLPMAVGLGFGAADVRLDSVLFESGADSAVLLGDTLDFSEGRIWRRLGNTVGRYGDGVTTISTPAMPRGPRSVSRPKLNTFVGSPSDYWGKLSVGLDHRGHPLFIDRVPQLADSGISPYELDLASPRDGNSYVRSMNDPFTAPDVDQPFTPAEMEALLRINDPDNAATLPPRLLTMLLGDLSKKDLVTTDSWDTPGLIGSVEWADANNVDLDHGLRMDLNRPFGDGADSDGDGVIDEPDETGLGPDNQNELPSLPANSADPFGTVGAPGAPNWDDCGLTRGKNPSRSQPGPPRAGLRARQIMAENLFRIAQEVAPPGYAPRQLAQWAVNVVDFLDADSIMTPFRYGSGTDSVNVVWGCEQPDLIITETLAFHDRAIADTDQDSGPQKIVDPADPDADPDFDQIRVPQGSLFVELYAVRNPNAGSLPRELYSASGLLDLGRTPENQTKDGTAPIWRLSISELRGTGDSGKDAFLCMRQSPENEWLAPRGAMEGTAMADFIGTLSSNNGGSIPLQRYVWFNNTVNPPPRKPNTDGTPSVSDPSPNEYNTFRWAGGTTQLKPGNYLVVGPRPKTFLGSKVGAERGVPSPQRIVLNDPANPSALVYGFQPSDPSNNAGRVNPTWSGENGFDPLPPAGGRPETQTCWVQAKGPEWDDVPHSIGLNISEKRGDNYYEKPPQRTNAGNFASPPYGPLADSNEKYIDAPQDHGSPLANADLLAQGTHLNVATVFLERLADPTRPHDPIDEIYRDPGDINSGRISNPNWNPYIVVDLMPIDLTVFNGETSTKDPSVTAADQPFYFHTRQRGFDEWAYKTTREDDAGDPYDAWARRDKDDNPLFDLAETLDTQYPRVCANPWRPLMPYGKDKADTTPTKPQPEQTTAATANQAVAHFAHELGIVDDPENSGEQKPDIPFHTLGWLNLSYGRRLGVSEVPPAYVGAPSTPFPWIVWNDRPFANEYELLYVPRTPASRLLTDYRDIDAAPVELPTEEKPNPAFDQGPFGASQPGWHLLPLTSITDAPPANNANSLSRIFSYVRVQSPFKGTTVPIDSDDLSTPTAYKAPFNRIPTFREPGRVNINTIPAGPAGARVWNAICGSGTSTPTPNWDAISALRADRPFESSLSVARGKTLLADDPNGPPPKALFTAPSPPGGSGPIHTAFSPEKSAWFRFQTLTRAASNTTTRSEVYAIWVTAGLFEVEAVGNQGLLRSTDYPAAPPTAFDPLPVRRYPDGLRLTREYGMATGDVKRYRAFYLFDRSLPVWYEPGADHNVSNAILVERFIE